MNPVKRGFISYSDLKNGSLNLYDLFILNDVIEEEERMAEEQRRAIERQRALNRKKK